LGKVFENLLAAYNPETGTTARKQTGSFYTPREIVNFYKKISQPIRAYQLSLLILRSMPLPH
jgi:type I restriction-modification system DNA methylase subunit